LTRLEKIFLFLRKTKNTPVTEAKVELKENIQKSLLDNVFYYNGLEITKETYLDY